MAKKKIDLDEDKVVIIKGASLIGTFVTPAMMTLTLYTLALFNNPPAEATFWPSLIAFARIGFGLMIFLLSYGLNISNTLKGNTFNNIATGAITVFLVAMIKEPATFGRLNLETLVISVACAVFIFISAESNAKKFFKNIKQESRRIALLILLYLLEGTIIYLWFVLLPRLSWFAK